MCFSIKVKAATVVGLIRYGGLDGIVTSAEVLKAMLDSPKAAHRQAAAWTIGRVGVRTFYRCLIPLLEERDPASLAACGDALFPLLHLNAKQWLQRMLVSEHEWTVVCTLQTIGRLQENGFESTVRLTLASRRIRGWKKSDAQIRKRI